MLFGRRTWQDFITAWARLSDGNPVTTRMNAATKYVVSRTVEDAAAWPNSILLRGEALERVAARRPSRAAIWGSSAARRSCAACTRPP
jgi:dihydrofolate reductase